MAADTPHHKIVDNMLVDISTIQTFNSECAVVRASKSGLALQFLLEEHMARQKRSLSLFPRVRTIRVANISGHRWFSTEGREVEGFYF